VLLLLLLLLIIIIIIIIPVPAPIPALAGLGLLLLLSEEAEAIQPVDPELAQLVEENRDILERLRDLPGDQLSPEELRRLLRIGREVLTQLRPAGPADPNAMLVRELIERLSSGQRPQGGAAAQGAPGQGGPTGREAVAGDQGSVPGVSRGERPAREPTMPPPSGVPTSAGGVPLLPTSSRIPPNTQPRRFRMLIVSGIDRNTPRRDTPYPSVIAVRVGDQEPFAVNASLRVVASDPRGGTAVLEFGEALWIDSRQFGIAAGTQVAYQFGR
jgi:hypothetical protein